MSNEIIEQGPGFTIYRTTDWGPPVPYPNAEREESVNHGFFDLRDRPEQVEEIPEAQGSPGLQSILRALNRAGGPLMSLGCELRLNDVDKPDIEIRRYMHSYTDITYRNPERNSEESQLVHLAKLLLSRIEGSNEVMFGFELGIQKMKHFFGNSGYNLSLGISGYGRTDEQATAAYEFAAERTAPAINSIT
jgi:hypothetical protein